MSLLEKATIITTPTAQSNGKLHSIKGGADADFDVVRDSLATRVNAEGLIENISVIGDEEITNGAFARQGSEIADNSTISNLGTAIMTKLSPLNYNATSGGGESTIRPRLSLNDVTQGKYYRIRVSGSNQSGNVNFKLYNGSEYVITGNDLTTDIDLYFKAEGATFIAFDGSDSFNVDFTISLVEVGQFWTFETGWSVGENKAISDGSGSVPLTDLVQSNVFTSGSTYKISLQIEDFVSGNLQLQNNTTDFPQSNGTHVIYYTAGGSSLILRSLSFIGSITNISVKEIIDATNIPRIDYTTGEGVILTEPQSTNLITYSEDFSDASWNKVRSSVSSNEIVSPSGNLDAYKFFDSTDNNTHLVFDSQSVNIGSVYSFSFFIKKGTLTKAFLAWNSAINQSVVFDLENGLVDREGVDVDSSNIEDYGNDWFKCSFTHTASMPNILYRVGTYDGNITYTGTGNDYVYIWGAQLEELPYSTSYIPTSGATATRFADELSGAGSTDLINSEEGVLYADISALADSSTNRYISLSDGTQDNRILIRYGTLSNSIGVYVEIGNAPQINQIIAFADITTSSKVALKYKLNDYALWVDGSEVYSSANSLVPSIGTLNALNFSSGDGSFSFYGKTKTVAVFSEALSDEELTCLTTI